ncbi:MAG: flagellar hook-basal body complex protein FliE [Bacillota bacterium]|nr:flagellar hook-basal body complex protein FliE [Bacillota bacterium]
MQVNSVSQYMNLVNKQLDEEAKSIDFSSVMKNYLSEVNELQVVSDKSTEDLILGETENVHEVMIKAEEARLALELTVQVRNKVIEAYQELIRMQI